MAIINPPKTTKKPRRPINPAKPPLQGTKAAAAKRKVSTPTVVPTPKSRTSRTPLADLMAHDVRRRKTMTGRK